MGWSDSPITSLTLPQSAGPNDPQIFIGPTVPPELIAAYAVGGRTCVAVQLFKVSSTEYEYLALVNAAGVAYLAMGSYSGGVVREQFAASAGILSFGQSGGGTGLSKSNYTVGVGSGTAKTWFYLSDYTVNFLGPVSMSGPTISLSSAITLSGTLDAHLATLGSPGIGGLYLGTLPITVNGTYDLIALYPTLRAVRYRISGGGGGGGGVALTAAAQAAAAGGGGAGCYGEFWALRATITDPVSVTLGTGGAGAAAGNNTGTAGGSTILQYNGVTFMSVPGGTGGQGSASVAGPSVAAGGSASASSVGCDVTYPGSDGANGVVVGGFATQHGPGGASLLGGSVRPSSANAGGAGISGAGYGPGSGGSGAFNQASQGTAKAGGLGAAGACYIDIWQ